MVTGWINLIVNVVSNQTAKNFGLQEENMDCKKKTSTSPNCREIPLIGKTGWGTREREGETDGQKERENGREDAILY